MSIHKLGSTPKLHQPTVQRSESPGPLLARKSAEASSRPTPHDFSRDRFDGSIGSTPKTSALEQYKEKLDSIVDTLKGDTSLDTRGKLTKEVARMLKEQGIPKQLIRETVDRIFYARNDNISIAGHE